MVIQNIKRYWPAVIIAIIVIFVGAIIIDKKQPTMILFYGDTCPHCDNVEEYVTTNNVKSKLSFKELEVFNNQTNNQLLVRKASQCGLDISQGVGVPFFFDGRNCIVGDQDIINFFKTK